MPGDLAAGIGKAVGAAAGGAVTGGASSIFDAFASLFQFANSDSGQEALRRLLPSPAAVAAEQVKIDAAWAAERPVGPADTR